MLGWLGIQSEQFLITAAASECTVKKPFLSPSQQHQSRGGKDRWKAWTNFLCYSEHYI